MRINPAKRSYHESIERSEAYRLALKLYAGRYEMIAARDAADILREVIEKHMPGVTNRQQPKMRQGNNQANEREPCEERGIGF